MAELSTEQRMAISGLLGTIGYQMARIAESEGKDCETVRDAYVVAGLIGWTPEDVQGLWDIALEVHRGCDVRHV